MGLQKPHSFLLVFLAATSLFSCSGYRFRRTTNPLAEYGISTVSVPMFLNRTSIANVAGPFTKEFIKVLSQFRSLKVTPGDGGKSDAVLLGVITGARQNTQTFVPSDRVYTSAEGLKESIGGRLDFYISRGTSMGVAVDLILIKNPTHREIELIKSEVGQFIKNHPKIVFRESVGASGSFTRILNQTTSIDEGGVVNFTQSKGLRDKTIITMAQGAADNFKNYILYAF